MLSDVDMGGILELIKRNVGLNSKFIQAKVSVLGLDFFAKEWSAELENKLKEVNVILAADGKSGFTPCLFVFFY